MANEAGEHLDDGVLADYATRSVLRPGMAAGTAAAHLSECRICQERMQQLLNLTQAAFSGELTPDAGAGEYSLAFLDPAARRARYRIPAGEVFLGMQALGGLAGATRGMLVGRYTQPLGELNDASVTVEIFTADTKASQGRVRVGVDVPGRDPLDQSGARVTLRIGAGCWSGATDDAGWVELGPVPLAGLAQMRIEIDP